MNAAQQMVEMMRLQADLRRLLRRSPGLMRILVRFLRIYSPEFFGDIDGKQVDAMFASEMSLATCQEIFKGFKRQQEEQARAAAFEEMAEYSGSFSSGAELRTFVEAHGRRERS